MAFRLNNITPIDKKTVNQICSGQVILNLGTAVKELLENSLDAGATSIQVRLKEYGSASIDVIDNGCGVQKDNFQGLTLKHHTSKLREFDDLQDVGTFGFRGEALSSLCSLASLSIVTRHKDAEVATKLSFDHNGVIKETTTTARPVGTTVTVENLFCTLPVRQKEFLRNLRRDFGKMCSIVQAYALFNNHCSISVTNRTAGRLRPVLETRVGPLRSNISAIFGLKQLNDLLAVKTKNPDEDILEEFRCKSTDVHIELSGFISSCAHGCGRSAPDRQFIYINTRPVDSSKITRLVNDTYHQYNPHQYPFSLLDIRVKTGAVDVNVVPDKRQVLLEHESMLLATLKSSLRSIFVSIPASLLIQNRRVQDEQQQSLINTSSGGLLRFLAPGSAIPAISSESSKQQSKFNSSKQMELGSFLKRNMTIEATVFRGIPDAEPSQPDNSEEFPPHAKKFKYNEGMDLFHCDVETNNDTEVRISKDNSEITEPSPDSRSIVPMFEGIPHGKVDGDDEKKSLTHLADLKNKNSFKITIENLNPENSVNSKFLADESSMLPAEAQHERNVPDSRIAESSTPDSVNCLLLDDFSSSRPICEMQKVPQSIVEVDEGLAEDVKDSRRTIVVNMNLEDIVNKRVIRKKVADSGTDVRFFAKIDPSTNERAEEELRRQLDQSGFINMQILGQFNRGFIITQLSSDLFIIDQHATDEKYNFEQLSGEKVKSQPLTIPLPLRLTVDREELFLSQAEVIKANGFDFVVDNSADSSSRIRLTAVPVTKGVTLGPKDIDELLFLLEDAPSGQMCRPSRVRDILASKACRMSVMVGTSLNHREMQRLVHHMGDMDQPWNCPHGRPTIRHLLSLDLIRQT